MGFLVANLACLCLASSLVADEQEQFPLKVLSARYETLNDDSGNWETQELEAVYDRGFWHHWEKHATCFRYSLAIESFESLLDAPESYYFVINMPGSYEVKLDGKRVGMNGKVVCENGSCKEVLPGKNRSIFIMPNSFVHKGLHELVLTGYRSPKWVALHHAGIHIKPLNELIVQERWHIINYGSYLVYFVFGVFFLSTYLTRRETLVHFYLGTICLLFSMFALNKLAYYHLDLSYRQAAWALNLVYSLNYVISLLAHLLLFEALKFKRWLSWALIPIPVIVAFFIEGFDSFGVLKITYEWLTIISVVAIFLRRKHAFTATIILATLSVVYSMRLFDKQQFVIYFALFLYLLFSIALAFYKQNKEKQEALLTNTRLNLELVKNKIQPHFILNSITSAMEWIESNPKQGAEFLNALAKEFEVLSRMTDQKLIPVGIEIDSCNNYLRVMEFRKKAHYTLTLKDVSLNETLPPSIIRNLLENAISHNSFGKQSVEFILQETRKGKRRIYTFRSPYSGQQDESSVCPPEGTGIQYIKARLMESFRNRWSFEHGPLGKEWITKIEIY